MKVIISLLALGVVVMLIPSARQAFEPLSGGQTSYAERKNNGEVSFSLRPRGIEKGQFIIEIRVDTHSGNLAEIDLRKAVTLRAGGVDYKPVDASSMLGHHYRGTLAFALDAVPQNFEIKIRGVREMGELTFDWP